jgi:hypothetical protein
VAASIATRINCDPSGKKQFCFCNIDSQVTTLTVTSSDRLRRFCLLLLFNSTTGFRNKHRYPWYRRVAVVRLSSLNHRPALVASRMASRFRANMNDQGFGGAGAVGSRERPAVGGHAERRLKPRFAVNLPVRIGILEDPGASTSEGRIIDISESGLAFIGQDFLPLGAKISVECDGCLLHGQVCNLRAREYGSRPAYVIGIAINEVLTGAQIWRQLLQQCGAQDRQG